MIEPKVLRFLRDLDDNNSKDWMDDNRDRYHAVKDHLQEVAEKLISDISEFDDEIAKANISGADALQQLAYDQRFHDHDVPYQTGWTISICASGNHKETAAYWLHIEPANCFCGGGTVMTSNDPLQAMRDRIAEHWEKWCDLMNRDRMEDLFPKGMTSKDSLKTAPQGYDEDHPAIEYLRMKDFRLRHDLTHDEIQGDAGRETVREVFETLQPVVTFLNEAVRKRT